MTKRAIFITINGIKERSGGGLYARNIVDYLNSSVLLCHVFSKRVGSEVDNEDFTYLKKSVFSDLLSRALLSPTFLFLYFFKFASYIKANKIELVCFHNSRCGMVGFFLKLFLRVKVYSFFDNVESELALSNGSFRSIKGVLSYLDYLLCKLTDWLSLSISARCFFITKNDSVHYVRNSFSRKYAVLPIRLPYQPQSKIADYKYDVLFTGSFDFYPNRHAFEILSKVAKKMPEVSFLVAGKEAVSLDNSEHAPNISYLNSPSNHEMQNAFRQSKVYFTPVEIGSGMKTKVAEAMSNGLPVVASHHSLIGYELVSEQDFIKQGCTLEEYKDHIKDLLSLSTHDFENKCRRSYDGYKKNYCFSDMND